VLGHAVLMPTYLIHHEHAASECAAAYAAWNGFESPLRNRRAASTCLLGGHAIWWRVRARDRAAAFRLLPRFIARRTTLVEIRDVEIP
jgi:hypothetical protein